jgi:hypothetical protein
MKDEEVGGLRPGGVPFPIYGHSVFFILHPSFILLPSSFLPMHGVFVVLAAAIDVRRAFF